jgi:predicted anti-sigma-YlaC factor YlaD
MMTDPHVAAAELKAFAAAELPADDLARVDRHLASCPSCIDALASLTASRRVGLLAAIDAERRRHLTFDEMEATVEDRPLDPLARAHLESCESCRVEVEDLRTFAASMADDAEAPAAAATVPPSPSLVAAITAWMHANARVVGLGGAIAVVTLLVTLPQTRSLLFPGGGPAGSSVASVQGALSSLSVLQTSLQLQDDRVARMRQILAGTAAPGPARTPTADDRALLARAERAAPDAPLVLGALAQDLGLMREAEGFYRRALEAQPDSPDIRRLLGSLRR